MSGRTLLYHLPYPLEFVNPGGGMVRPAKMLQALETQGDVWLVAGDARTRKQKMREVRQAINDGQRFDLCYSESSTMPTALTERHHLPLHPFQDFTFLAQLRSAGIPVGLFYRDIEWRFPMYRRLVPWYKAYPALAMYRADLLAYGRVLDRLFLPSKEMSHWVPLPPNLPCSALPPGHDVEEIPGDYVPSPLRLLYVGGFRNKYRLHEVLAAVHMMPEVSLTVCTRPDEWDAARPEYEPWLGENIQVIHEHGEGLIRHLRWANLAVVAAQPQDYWQFAAPLKLYEYIGNGLPVLATEGTLAGHRVREMGIGWAVPYGRHAFAATLQTLIDQPKLLEAARVKVMAIRHEHTWKHRAVQVVEELMNL